MRSVTQAWSAARGLRDGMPIAPVFARLLACERRVQAEQVRWPHQY